MKKLAIVSSHPIQYNAPWFRLLAERQRIAVKVFYTWSQSKGKIFDPGFGREREWDIPLLSGYAYEFVENIAADPGSHHFWGIRNPALIKSIEAYGPDAVLIFGWNFYSHLKAMHYFKSKRQVLFRGDSTLLDESTGISFRKMFRYVWLKWVYRQVDIALYTGIANKEYFVKYGLKSVQLVWAPHTIDNSRFATGASDGNGKIRKNVDIPDDGLVFVFAGKLEPKKNPSLLIEAFTKLNHTKTYLLLVGEGVLEQSLKKQVAGLENTLQNRIIFLPFQNQMSMPQVYSAGDVYCLPSKGPGETWGLAVNEAMACGKPVLISNRCGCHADLVQDGINGMVFKSGDVEDLLHKMQWMVEHRNSLPVMGVAAAEKIRGWSYENVCTSIESVVTGDY